MNGSRAAFVGVVVLTLAPTIAAALSLVGRHWHPASDLAIQVLQIDDVGGRHTPLTGAHSRYGWDHPGPLLPWLLAPFDWLFGTTGILVGVAVINSAAIVGALVLARRRGGFILTVLVAAALLVPPRAPMFGDWRTARPEDVDATVLVIGSSDAAPDVDAPPGAVEVARAESVGGQRYAVYLVGG